MKYPTVAMSMLSWIHLSDWHQKGASFDRGVVRDALLQDISERTNISEEPADLDFVIFSGDLAFSGSADEYNAANREFIGPVLNACGLSESQFLIVPGNHDVDRNLAARIKVGLEDFSGPDALAQFWKNPALRNLLLTPMGPYSEFIKTLNLTSSSSLSPYAHRHLAKLSDGETVAFLCLNSAWLCGRNRDVDGNVDDYGQLILGETQIEEALSGLEKCRLIVGILHHPFPWLALKNGVDDRLKSRGRLMSVCDIILHGHEHEPGTVAQQGTYGNCIVIPAGSTFEKRNAMSQHYANGYNCCRLDLSQRKCKVHFRRFDGNRSWHADVQTVGGETSGSLELQMPDGPTKPFHKHSSGKGATTPPLKGSSYPRMAFEKAHLIHHGDPDSPGRLDATVLDRDVGGFELCLYLNSFGEGIRKLVNNRHILAHAVSPSSPYKNVFSFHRGPYEFVKGKIDVPRWQLWLASDGGSGNSWRYKDTEQIKPGWHDFLVTWDHKKPLLQLLLDGDPIIKAMDYLSYWPSQVLTSMTVGCWPNPWREHYIDTWVAHIRVLDNHLDADDLAQALKRCRRLQNPPTTPNGKNR